MLMFSYLEALLQTDDTKILFILALIAGAMIIDFLSGVIAAKINDDIEFKSKIGINGIIRKLASLILLLFFIPLSVLIPVSGTAVLYVLYLGYLGLEIQSIFENYKKMGNDTSIFEDFMKKINPPDDEGGEQK